MVDVPDAPFTGARLRIVLVGGDGVRGVLRLNQVAPPATDLEDLATILNRIRERFGDMLKVGNAGRSMREDAIQAICTLDVYFDRRLRLCIEPGRFRPISQVVIDAELHLAAKYYGFTSELRAHEFQLAMDDLLSPRLDDWHDLAWSIASHFKHAMLRSSGFNDFGRSSNTGPIPRFVAAVIPEITGETPSVETVGQHLKRRAKLDTVK